MKPVLGGVLWDLDGVLFDTGEFHFRSWAETLPGYDIPFSQEIFLKIFGMKNRESIPLIAGRELQPDLVDEIGERKESLFRQIVRGQAQPLPGVIPWLERFAGWGVRQAVASSAPLENVEALLDDPGMRSFFTAVVSAEGLAGKPDPAIFLRAAALIEAAPENCLVFEDATSGVEAARRAGMKCIAVTTTNPAAALNRADLVVERLDQLSVEELAGLMRISDGEG